MKSKKNQIELEKNKVFKDVKYQKLSIENRLTILHIVKNWIQEEINKQENFLSMNTIFQNEKKQK